MPGSVGAGKEWIKNRLATATDISRILDLGPGAGTYSKLFRKLYPDAEWTAIEAWAPYVPEFNLRSHYNHVIVGDVRYIDYERLGSFDLCFCGDILEHMPEADARDLGSGPIDPRGSI